MINTENIIDAVDVSKNLNTLEVYMFAVRDWAIDFVPKLVGALLVIWIGYKIANLFSRFLEKFLTGRDFEPTAQSFLVNLLKYTLKGLVIIAAVGILGVQTSSFVALFAAAGFAIGSALSGSLSNFASGIIILLFKPYTLGDWIEIDGIGGNVVDVNIFSTKIRTLDTREVVIPNSNAIGNKVINFSAYDQRMLEIEVGISYSDSIDLAREILLKIAADKNIIEQSGDEKPKVLVKGLGDNAVIVALRIWVSKEDFMPIKFELLEEIKKEFDNAGLNFPFPQRDIHIVSGEKTN